MDCPCNCYGIASSSRVPVKRYNLLVPDIFPKKQPDVSDKVDASTERKYKKLYEYIAKNPHRGPKASRRLARRAHKDLHSRHFGYVQVAAHAYVYLLKHLPPEDSNLFARELIMQHVDRERGRHSEDPSKALESVVGALLQSQNLQARILGAQLFAAFTHIQGSLEYAGQLEVLMHLLLPSISLSGAGIPTGGASPRQGELVGLQVAALQALREFILYSGRAYASKESQREAADCVMDLLLTQTAPGGPLPCDRLHAEDEAGAPLGGQQGKPQPVQAALSCMDALLSLCQDAAEGREVVRLVFDFMDKRGVWQTRPDAYTSAIRRLQQVCAREGQDSMVLSILLRHIRSLPQGALQQTMLLCEAARQAQALPSPFAIPALISTLQELPYAMPEGAPQAAAAPAVQAGAPKALAGTREQILELVRGLAATVGSSGLILEVLGGVCTRFVHGADAPRGNAIACFQAALQGASKAAHAPGSAFPATLTECLAGGMADSAPAQRTSAHMLGCAALQQVDGQLPDSQSVLLLSAAWLECIEVLESCKKTEDASIPARSHPCCIQALLVSGAALLGGTPASLASLDLLLEGLIRTAGLPAKMRALQWALSLRHQILSEAEGGHFRAAGQAQQLVLLYIYNAVLLRLSAALGSRKLPEMLLHLIAAECPRIRLTNHGLQAAAEDASFEASDQASAGKALQRLRSEESTDRTSATKASGALADSSALRGQPQAQAFLGQLRQPFDTSPASSASKNDPTADQAHLVRRLEAIFPTSAAAQGSEPVAAAAVAPTTPQVSAEQQGEVLAMSDANGAAMADLLSALDTALQNGGHGIGGVKAQNQGKQWQADHVAAVQTNGLRVGGVLQL